MVYIPERDWICSRIPIVPKAKWICFRERTYSNDIHSVLSSQIESGDVVAYQTMDGTAVIHRVVDYGDTEDSYITKGDANNTVDGNQVAREQILGRYVKHIPMLGFLMSGIDGHVLHIGGLELPAVIPIVVGVMILLFVVKWFTGRAEEDE